MQDPSQRVSSLPRIAASSARAKPRGSGPIPGPVSYEKRHRFLLDVADACASFLAWRVHATASFPRGNRTPFSLPSLGLSLWFSFRKGARSGSRVAWKGGRSGWRPERTRDERDRVETRRIFEGGGCDARHLRGHGAKQTRRASPGGSCV